METTEIQERNKQIALMLGAIVYKADKWYKLGGYKQHIYFPNRKIPNRFLEHQLKFHSDWNWLHDAVEFIEKSADWSLECLHIDNKVIFQVMVPLGNINIVLEDKKEAVFIAVSDFASLYNEKKL